MAAKVNSNYFALYTGAASLIPQGSQVIEIGCGDGPFIPYIENQVKSYVGLDKDASAIGGAAKFCRHRQTFKEGKVKLIVCDVMDAELSTLKGRTIVALEVLEHIEDDLAVLEKLHKGTRVIFSVPSFDADDHKRFFPSENEAISRYLGVLDLDFWRKIRIPTGAGYFHLMRGYR